MDVKVKALATRSSDLPSIGLLDLPSFWEIGSPQKLISGHSQICVGKKRGGKMMIKFKRDDEVVYSNNL
jgi:hypothetical protein